MVNYLNDPAWVKFILKASIEVSILWFVIYQIVVFFTGTRALQVIRGIIVLLIVFFMSQKLGFTRLEWLLTKMFALSVLGLLIIFQPEIRRGLAQLGRQHLFTFPLREQELDYFLKEIAKSVDSLAQHSVGALIAIEREVPLKPYIETGVTIDGMVTSELLQTIFTPGSLLHDGGVIIQQGRIIAAACLFPLEESSNISRTFGMRHRAAMGLTQDTDALVVVVSEERQDISLVYEGIMLQHLKHEELFLKLKQLIKNKKK